MSGGTWSYDGSLEGLIVLAHRAYSETASPDAVANALASEGELFALLGPQPLEPATADLARAQNAGAQLRAFSSELFDMVIRIWMSEESLELPLFRVCAQAGRHGAEALADHGNPDLRALSQASRRVCREIERLKGFARFSPGAGGMLVAALEPDHNVACSLMPHFARRFGGEDFAIVDLRRRLSFARRGGAIESAAGEEALALVPGAATDEDLQLWRRYFKATENPSRKNLELQRRLMPRRYWRFLPELSS
jgi:probable DNA metabolism protein